jgi:D12 class N6 adenine-specific DNA methyltransferase
VQEPSAGQSFPRGVPQPGDTNGLDQRTADTFLPQHDECPSLVTATGLHHHQLHSVFTAESGQFCDARRIYFDPPYSKFQYSRFYHLLNVLISYDYPSIHGVGRYPPLVDRFSSRFEHNSNPALSEFEDAFDLCRDLGLRVFVSYSNRGLVAADALIDAMSRRFAESSDRIRHHSQGTRLGDHLGYVTEFVLAARND